MKHRFASIGLVAVALLAAACDGSGDSLPAEEREPSNESAPEPPQGSPVPAADAGSPAIDGVTWHLLGYRLEDGRSVELLPVDAADQTLTFEGAPDGTASITGYCVLASVGYASSGDRLATFDFEDLGDTFGCTGPAENGVAISFASGALQRIFDDGATFAVTRTDDRLTLDADDGRRLVLGTEPPSVPGDDLPFANVTWTLEADRLQRATAETPVLRPVSLEPVLDVAFGGDGAFVAGLGCLDSRGTWSLFEGRLSVEDVVGDGECAVDELPYEQQILQGLLSGRADPVAVTVDGERLFVVLGENVLVFSGRRVDASATPATVDVLERGDRAVGGGEPDAARRFVAYRDQASLDAEYAVLRERLGDALGPTPIVDFTRYTVVGAFLALESYQGSEVTVRAARATADGLEVLVATREAVPDELTGPCYFDAALSAPFVFARVESRAEPVRIVERVTSDCTGLPAVVE